MLKTASPDSSRPIPLPLKLAYTAFVAVLVVYYWAEYGPTNFLYFCDLALFLTLWSVWTERSLAASMAGVGILLPQLGWQVDFLSTAAGIPLLGLTDYMFDDAYPLFARGLSFFHFWLPLLIVFVIARLGYDRRALVAWTLPAWAVMLISYGFLPAAGAELDWPTQPRNINYVFGPSSAEPQTMMPPLAWLALLLVGLPLVVYLPTHLVLQHVFGRRHRVGHDAGDAEAAGEVADDAGDDPKNFAATSS